MKFGKYLESQIREEWREFYLNYNELKEIIAALASVQALDVDVGKTGFGERVTSLTMVPNPDSQTNYNGKVISETDFFSLLENEMVKLDKFVGDKLSALREEVEQVANDAHRPEKLSDSDRESLKVKANELANSFLKLEKFVNINYLGFHKILKKHDKVLAVPCRRFYLTRLHNQQWVKRDHSKVFVRLSQIHASLRGDVAGSNDESNAQGFVRTTTKYWIRTSDISRVKSIVLQHLPIFQHDLEALSGDSQLTNSVYFDNAQLELYHGRIEKKPGAIAIRIRWYETDQPNKVVFVERKTHHDKWTGDVSVKERFTLSPDEVMPFIKGEFTVEDKMAQMKAKGKSERDMNEVYRLFTEIYQQIDSKQLRPTMRTQYMRAAYQIPFDATVRISLDTNLKLMCENPKDGPTCWQTGRWYRDPLLQLPNDEITNFPHAVLEVKLSLRDGQLPPQWVSDLIDSGMLTEVHKFSKFVHGCAVLLTDEVQFAPYWIDDASIRASVLRSQSVSVKKSMKKGSIAADPLEAVFEKGLLSKNTISLMKQKNSFDARSPSFAAHKSSLYGTIDNEPARTGSTYMPPQQGWLSSLLPWNWVGAKHAGYHLIPRKTPMKIEPKVYFANERTFLSWLHMSITLGSISAGLLGLSVGTGSAIGGKGGQVAVSHGSQTVGLILLPVSLVFCVYALWTFHWRGNHIGDRVPGQMFNDMIGPSVLALLLACSLAAVLVLFLVGGTAVKV